MKKIYITADEIECVSCPGPEQETTICWLRDEDTASICVTDNTMITKLKKAMAKDPNNYKCFYYEGNVDPKNGKLFNYFFEIPKKLISFRSSRTKVTDPEAKAKRAERMRMMRERKKNSDNGI